jgi:hypothetical protein
MRHELRSLKNSVMGFPRLLGGPLAGASAWLILLFPGERGTTMRCLVIGLISPAAIDLAISVSMGAPMKGMSVTSTNGSGSVNNTMSRFLGQNTRWCRKVSSACLKSSR